MMQTIPIKYHNNIINKIIEKISFLDNVFVKRINLLASSDKLVSAHYRNNSFNELEIQGKLGIKFINMFVKRINLLASSDKLVSAHYRNNSFNELENIISNQTILKNSLFLKFFHKIFLDKGVVN